MTFDKWRQWWIERAPQYFTDKIWRFSQPQLIERLKIEPHHCVLELGFGYGRELSQFCKLSNHVYGLELTDWSCENTLIELNDRGVEPLPILKSYDGLTIPYPTESFQIVYSCFVIQHLSREHAKELIKEALRVTSWHGKVLFEFFGDPSYYADGGDVFSGDENDGGMFNNAYLKEEIPTLIESCGGRLEWLETTPIAHEWGNYWVCFGKNNER
jgi:ubiquinone/menaquinone biosynthesis C-methylase UbiE